MPGGRRTDRISKRDLEVLAFIARYGVVPRDVVALWAETARAVTAARERRLREAGLVEVLAGVGASGRLVLCTRQGLRAARRAELPLARFSPATTHHSAVVARIGAQLERGGRRVLSEREIYARERAEGARAMSAQLSNERFRRPDLIVLPDTAVEVELTEKSAGRLEELLRSWWRVVARRRFGAVHYLCSSRALPQVERAVARLGASGSIGIGPLEQRDGRLVLPESSLLLGNRQGRALLPHAIA